MEHKKIEDILRNFGDIQEKIYNFKFEFLCFFMVQFYKNDIKILKKNLKTSSFFFIINKTINYAKTILVIFFLIVISNYG